jgi:hypothetical protein
LLIYATVFFGGGEGAMDEFVVFRLHPLVGLNRGAMSGPGLLRGPNADRHARLGAPLGGGSRPVRRRVEVEQMREGQ